MVEILQKLYSSGADDLGLNFINELTVRFCHCPKWVGRQAFAFICQVCGASPPGAVGERLFSNGFILNDLCDLPSASALPPQAVVEEDCMPMEQFSKHLLPSLLSLSSDPVANVRVLVAKALRQSVMEKGAHAGSGQQWPLVSLCFPREIRADSESVLTRVQMIHSFNR